MTYDPRQRRHHSRSRLAFTGFAVLIAIMVLVLGLVLHHHTTAGSKGMRDARQQQQDDAFSRLQKMADAEEIRGRLSVVLGQNDAALKHLSLALVLSVSSKQPALQAQTLTDLGTLYGSQGQTDRATSYLTQSNALLETHLAGQDLSQHDQRKCNNLKASNFISLGDISGSQGEWEKAKGLYTRAAALILGPGGRLGSKEALAASLSEGLGNEDILAASLSGLGNVLQAQGSFQQALTDHEQALAIRQHFYLQAEIAQSLNRLGELHTELGQYQQAFTCYHNALQINESLQDASALDASALIDTWNGLGTLYLTLGQWQKSAEVFQKALRQFEMLKGRLADPSEMGALEQTRRSLYGHYAQLLLRDHPKGTALLMVEQGRAQGLARQAALTRKGLDHFLPPSEQAQLKAKGRTLTEAGKAVLSTQARALAEAAKDVRSAPAQESDSQWRQAVERNQVVERDSTLLHENLLARHPLLQQLGNGQKPSLPQLLNLARRSPKTLFLEWVVVDDRTTLLFALGQGGIRVFALPIGERDLQKKVQAWREALSSRGLTERQAASALSAPLLGKLQESGLLRPDKVTRLVIVPDGPLWDVPFAALIDAGGRRLIELYSVSTTVSMAVLTWPENPRRPKASLLCVVDPSLEGSSLEGPSLNAPVPPSSAVPAALRGGLGPLRYARIEANDIGRLFPSARMLSGRHAREGTVKALIGQYAVLHFATHAFLVPQDGLQSWLLLAPEPADSPEDGRLEASEVLSLPLSARLAVLSACETGRGQLSGGEGLEGLGWAFLAAGCPSVVCSSWQVDDQATAELMQTFYRGLRAGQRKDDALRAAMLAVRRTRGDGQGNAFYWAAFQILGDTTPLSARFLY